MKLAQENTPHSEEGTPETAAPEPYRLADFEHLRPPVSELAGLDGESIKFPSTTSPSSEALPLRKAAGAESLNLDAVGNVIVPRDTELSTPGPEASVGGVGGVGGGGWYRMQPASPVSRTSASREPGSDFAARLNAGRDVSEVRSADAILAQRAYQTLQRLRDVEILDIVRCQAEIEAAEFRRRMTVPPGMISLLLPPLPLPAHMTPRDEGSRISGVSAGSNSGSDQGRDERRRREREAEAADQINSGADRGDEAPRMTLPNRLQTGDRESDTATANRASEIASAVISQLSAAGRAVDSATPQQLGALWRSQLAAR